MHFSSSQFCRSDLEALSLAPVSLPGASYTCIWVQRNVFLPKRLGQPALYCHLNWFCFASHQPQLRTPYAFCLSFLNMVFLTFGVFKSFHFIKVLVLILPSLLLHYSVFLPTYPSSSSLFFEKKCPGAFVSAWHQGTQVYTPAGCDLEQLALIPLYIKWWNWRSFCSVPSLLKTVLP